MEYQVIFKSKSFQAYCPKDILIFKEKFKASYRHILGCWQFKFNLENYNEIKDLKDFIISDKVHKYFKKLNKQQATAKTKRYGSSPGSKVEMPNGKIVSWDKHCEFQEIFWPIFEKFNLLKDGDEKQYFMRIIQEIIGREVTEKEYNRGF